MIDEQSRIGGAAKPSALSNYKRLFFSAALLLIPAIAFLGWVVRRPTPVSAVSVPPEIRTVLVQRGDIEQIVHADGKLQLYKYADVNPEISGQIKQLDINLGDEVKAGKRLLRIEPISSTTQQEDNQAQLARLNAELAEQKAQLDFADLQFKRQTQLKAENATREETYEASRTAMYAATARVDAIKARIRQTELAIKESAEKRKHTEVIAPLSGTVVALSARLGKNVETNQQAALVRIADLSKLTVQARVAEIDVPHLFKGMRAHFTTPGYPGKQWFGKVRQIIPVPADGSGELGKETFYNVLFEVDNPERQLMSGMTVQVSFVLSRENNVVVLPADLLGKPDDKGLYTVTVVDNSGTLEQRKVRIGIRNKQMAQVLAGLQPGERVIASKPEATPHPAPSVSPTPSAPGVQSLSSSPRA